MFSSPQCSKQGQYKLVDDFDEVVIRNNVQEFYTHRHQLPTINNLLSALMKKILCRSVATRLQQLCGKGILCQRTLPIFTASGKVMANNFATSGKLP